MTRKIVKNVLISLILLLLLGVVLYLFGLLFGLMFGLLSYKSVHDSFRWFAIWYGLCAAFFIPVVTVWTWRNERRPGAMIPTKGDD